MPRDETTLYGHNLSLVQLEPHYSRHISSMTSEGLFSKSDIAAELAWRDMRIVGLERQLADRDDQMQAFIRKASEVPGLSATLDQVTWERDQLRKTLAERDDAIRKLQEAIDASRADIALVVDFIASEGADLAGVSTDYAEGYRRALCAVSDHLLRALEAKP